MMVAVECSPESCCNGIVQGLCACDQPPPSAPPPQFVHHGVCWLQVQCGANGAISIVSEDQGTVHAIDRLLGHGVRASDGEVFFRVQWKGSDEEEATWESQDSLMQTARPLVALYWNNNAHAPCR